jgi:hypothetical protein
MRGRRAYTLPLSKEGAAVEKRTRSTIVGGTLLILLGVFFLVRRIVPGLFETLSWPFIVIGVGVVFLLVALLTWTPGLAVPACIIGGIGGILYWQNSTGHWATWAYAWTLIPGFVGVGVFVSALMEGRPLKGLVEGGWPILISLVLFFLFGSFLGGLPWLGPYWAVLLIVVGVLVLLKPLVGLGRRKKKEE